MCDTLVALGNATQSRYPLFAKNSDRDPNEAHELLWLPRQSHPTPAKVKCTYIEIPQVKETNAILLSKPFWIWGAEMGSNEFGLTIGNEAVFTRIPHEEKPGLIGMDLLRLALERCQNAPQAVELITSLIAEYGQSGNCGFANPFQYHNSFLIADLQEACVLETAGREWAVEKVRSVRSISNRLTIGKSFDQSSPRLLSTAVKNGWCKADSDFDFARCYSDFLYTTFGDGQTRHTCTHNYLSAHAGSLAPVDMITALQQHPHAVDEAWSPDRALMGSDVCMHVGFGPIRINQTTGSMVSWLNPHNPIHWLTGTAAPCLSLFKPVWMDAGLPDMGLTPTGQYQPGTHWWEHEKLHRAVMLDYHHRKAMITEEQQSLQEKFLKLALEANSESAPTRLEITRQCFAESLAFSQKWSAVVSRERIHKPAAIWYKSAWNKINREAKLVL
jgi:secernin